MDMTAPQGAPAARPLLWGLLFYEALRLAVLTRILAGAGEGEFTPLVLGTANALFFFMALFLLVNFRRYAAYVPLYAAGKTLMVLVLAGCVFLGRHRIVQAIILGGRPLLYTAGGLAGIALGDLISAGAGLFLLRRVKPPEGIPEAETGNGEPGTPGGAAENGGL